MNDDVLKRMEEHLRIIKGWLTFFGILAIGLIAFVALLIARALDNGSWMQSWG